MKTYLVTGAAGFIGSGVASRLLDRGDAVVGIDNLNDFYSRALKEERLQDLLVRPSFQFHKVDIENFDDVEALFGKYRFQAVYNLAARAGVRYSMENPWIYMRTNADGTLNLLEAMRRNSVSKMVLASTSSLYAGLPMPFREDSPVNTPISPYAASKKAAEVMAYTYHRQYGLDISVLRYFTVFGPAGRPDHAVSGSVPTGQMAGAGRRRNRHRASHSRGPPVFCARDFPKCNRPSAAGFHRAANGVQRSPAASRCRFPSPSIPSIG